MPTLYLVRHGRAAAGWDADVDPGLDALGREQAAGVALNLAPRGPLELIASPMARTRETAAPLARAWSVEPRIEVRVSEIPSPTADLKARGQWLREIGARSWPALEENLRRWRADVIAALLEIERDAVIVTHYIAINVAVGAATNDDRVVNFHPDYCSVTMLRHEGKRLTLVTAGAEGTTRVL